MSQSAAWNRSRSIAISKHTHQVIRVRGVQWEEHRGDGSFSLFCPTTRRASWGLMWWRIIASSPRTLSRRWQASLLLLRNQSVWLCPIGRICSPQIMGNRSMTIFFRSMWKRTPWSGATVRDPVAPVHDPVLPCDPVSLVTRCSHAIYFLQSGSKGSNLMSGSWILSKN